MPDREKVINALEVTRKRYVYKKNGQNVISLDVRFVDMILALLKEQDALKPKKVKGYNPPMYTIYEYECEKCKSPMMNKQPFCMGCGRPVKWE